ncbi:bifunctional 3-phenylpropionate/cinnamic acid dioxygenase ferredoxin subunit [Pseudoclavibacter chungangensis]|uniref:Bifunctional 3-phenylpropionate/cinnamic acid dioxygenase ferredoxin subunit n=1 Tax=Pseudoclavibacter chungangensis TaxID=587635 RepID=A0A7J5BT57_9MICO|nr:bifunctional 3-phenylpropionate/cinnamic acid dioxygenase ferredoxin subunit [Pseudoclavibacter chungangensis]KAB1656656.1 bifunctional 3-phenylpropionate/cinnamic acid dioxygenase ferredoxin subunit [Pseudoclavibacter chungangensis]NYJ67896.1 3-phenylpropionate/trans-cinnamate dioxygenase ferredoxin subunit [Pseudoclavibacter chungangensis]
MLRICSLSDLTEDEGFRVESVTPPVAVFLTADHDVHVIDDTCTHQNASLAEGWVEDGCVECPLHTSRFSLTTGEADSPPAKLPVRVHRSEVVDGEVFVELSTATPNLPPGAVF